MSFEEIKTEKSLLYLPILTFLSFPRPLRRFEFPSGIISFWAEELPSVFLGSFGDNSLSFHLSENVFILRSFLEDNFCRILNSWSTVGSLHCLLAFIVSDEKFPILVLFFVMCAFSSLIASFLYLCSFAGWVWCD